MAFACQLADSGSGLQLRPHHSLALFPSVAAGISVAEHVQREPLGRRFAACVGDSEAIGPSYNIDRCGNGLRRLRCGNSTLAPCSISRWLMRSCLILCTR